MRIISGKYKGKIISPPKNFSARPTTDFAREGLFNIIDNNFKIEDLEVMDLFSGTGSISFEFASRASKKIYLYESNRLHFGFILKTIKELKFEQIIKAFNRDVFKSMARLNEQFDLIFADPPFRLQELDTIPDLVFNNKLLKEGGWLILEHPGSFNFTNHPHFLRHRNYGSVNFSFFK